jgi:hypothetical protein
MQANTGILEVARCSVEIIVHDYLLYIHHICNASTHTYTHIYICIYIYIHAYIYAYMHTYAQWLSSRMHMYRIIMCAYMSIWIVTIYRNSYECLSVSVCVVGSNSKQSAPSHVSWNECVHILMCWNSCVGSYTVVYMQFCVGTCVCVLVYVCVYVLIYFAYIYVEAFMCWFLIHHCVGTCIYVLIYVCRYLCLCPYTCM